MSRFIRIGAITVALITSSCSSPAGIPNEVVPEFGTVKVRIPQASVHSVAGMSVVLSNWVRSDTLTLSAHGEVVFSKVVPGDWRVQLITGEQYYASQNPRMVSVDKGASTLVEFGVGVAIIRE